MDLAAFRAAVDGYRRPTGHSQQELAGALGLHPNVLSHKLHASDGAALRHDEVRGIVRVLAAWQALATRAQAVELLGLMDLGPSSFSSQEWAAPPLAHLEADAAPAPTSRATAQPATGPGQRGWLPAELTPLVGRGDQVQQVLELLQGSARLVTLTGTGGVGKTRLALAVATALVRYAGTPVCLVALAAIRDPAFVAGVVAAELGLREPVGGGRGIDAVLLEYLGERHLLLVLDNFEQILGAAALVGEVLRAAPGVRVLVTSRVPLRVYGEHEFRVLPLRLPPPSATEPEVLASEAVALFVQRARAARADFRPEPAQATLLAAICNRVDGLPLAIELAAARVRHLALPVLLKRLAHRLDVLDRGPRDAPARQRTLRATLDWSYALLPGDRQRLFGRLGVFVGGCTLEAVRAVCADGGEDVEDGLWELIDAALLEAPDTAAAVPSEPRFRMLETVREYALARLAVSGEGDVVSERHARYFLDLAEQGEAALLENHSRPEWLERLEPELDNLRAATRWASDSGSVELELRLAAALGLVRMIRGHWMEGLGDLIKAVSHGRAAPSIVRAKALGYAAYMTGTQNDFATAQRLVDEGLPLARASADPLVLAQLLLPRAAIDAAQGRLSEASGNIREAIALLQAAGSKPAGLLRILRRQYATNLLSLGELDQSRQLHEQNLAEALASGDTYIASAVLLDLGTIAVLRVDVERAAACFREGLVHAARVGDPTLFQFYLDALAAVAGRQRHWRKSAVLLGAADKLRDDLGFTSAFTHRLRERVGFAAAIGAARAELGDADFEAARQAGFALSPDEALAEALADR
jgi:non-specific serine/threonine protein kinase